MKFTSPVYSTASGSIAGITYSHNRYGLYTRARTYPIDPNSIRQQALRALFTTMVVAWTETLTEVQRAAWRFWASNTTIIGKDGLPMNITGQNAYIRYNVIRAQIGGARVDVAPVVLNNGSPVTSIDATTDSVPDSIGVDVGVTQLDTTVFVAGSASADGDVAFYLGGACNPSRTFYKGPYQLAAVMPITALDADVDFTDLFTALLSNNGDPVEDQIRPVRFRIIYDDGRLTEPYSILAPVVAAAI